MLDAKMPSSAVEADIAYAGALGSKPEWHTARLSVPAGEGPFPLVVYFHGGFWKPEWDRGTTLSQLVTGTFSAAAGGETDPAHGAEASLLGRVATLDVEYSRVNQDEPSLSEGGGGWPGTHLDALAAVNALAVLQRTPSSGAAVAVAAARVDLRAAVVSGHSAGGQMALWLGMLSSLPAARRATLADAVGAVSGAAAAAAVAAGLDGAIRIVGAVGLAAVADLDAAGREGISDTHDAIPNLFWRR